jgi:Na+-translocating ferredoxin:NAD+ oxidoreductase RnfC subunit
MKKAQEYITYLSPEFIYVPFDNIELLTLSKNKKVFNNSLLGTKNDGSKIFSPVSGSVIGIRETKYSDFDSKALVIENDFIDKRVKLNHTRNMSKVKKSEIIESLEKYGLNKKINSKTTLVVVSKYDKKFDLKDLVINVESYEGILEAIDEFMDIFNMKTCYLCIDRNDLYSINAYEKYINAFLNICIVHSDKKFKDSTCVFYSIEEILAIYKAIHLDYMYDNTIITINNGNTTIVKVKLYSSLSELLKVLKIPYKSKNVYVNNKLIENIENFAIDSKVRSVVIKDK